MDLKSILSWPRKPVPASLGYKEVGFIRVLRWTARECLVGGVRIPGPERTQLTGGDMDSKDIDTRLGALVDEIHADDPVHAAVLIVVGINRRVTISCRVPPDVHPLEIVEAARDHMRDNVPKSVVRTQ